MWKTAFVVLMAVASAFAQPQQPRFEAADVHVSPTAPGFGQNFGGVLREGRYVNRDATMLNLIEAAYGVSEDNIADGPADLRHIQALRRRVVRDALNVPVDMPAACALRRKIPRCEGFTAPAIQFATDDPFRRRPANLLLS